VEELHGTVEESGIRRTMSDVTVVDLPVLISPDEDSSWRLHAACRNRAVEEFFSSNWKSAIKVCEVCVVRAQCLDFAVRNEIPNGIWGGKTPQARKDIL